MKPLDEVRLRILAEWLRKANADIELAEHLLSEDAIFPNAMAYHCQQAAEKYLKAFLTCHQVAFPKTHDIGQLLDLVEAIDNRLASSLRDVIVLSPYGIELRYPGDHPDVTSDEAREAVRSARKVRESVMKCLPPE